MAVLVITGCSNNQPAGQPRENTRKTTTVDVDGDYGVDISLVSDLVYIDHPQQAIFAYLRIQNSFYPVNLDTNETVLKLKIDNPTGEGYVRGVRIARYDGRAPINRGQIKKLVFGPVELDASDSIKTGVNEIDYFGNGSVDILVELKIVPPELPASDEEAIDYLKDLASDGSLNFSYDVTMSRGENRQIFENIQIKVPAEAFEGTQVFYRTFYL